MLGLAYKLANHAHPTAGTSEDMGIVVEVLDIEVVSELGPHF